MASKKNTRRGAMRYWGVAVILFALLGWFLPEVGPMWIAVAASLSVLYVFFQMPLPCGAWNRDKTRCRNNASGFLPGCHIEQHRWQSAKLMVTSGGWGELREKTLASWKRTVPALAAAATIISGIMALVQFGFSVVTA